ncbi:MAG TPA: RtcB family protein [Candidatus Pacearchaeota archaeon]|nr:RtcB family protein [Candidatus Pacearchaeota archaeon]HOK94004.1 RtcB family protein [Candidatus Pacearchaeota archaeon]HPO75075.1 RtcB family protein [Candidatus Pacearchaeota archaeon]
MQLKNLQKINNYQWEISKTGKMLVPGIIFGDQKLIEEMDEKVKEQVQNVACLPGIYKASLAMPDAHWGYGFVIGGVAAMDKDSGVISVGGIGFDSGCGVRALKTNLTLADVKPKIEELVNSLFETVPCGLGSRGKIVLSKKETNELFQDGARWIIKKGYGTKDDLEHIEDKGSLEGANPDYVSTKAKQREKGQVGTLGSGNHYEEIQYIDEIYDEEAAKKFGLFKNQILISIHCGSRALGHQIGTDYLKILAEASRKYHIPIHDRELVCAPIDSEEGKRYAAANLCALNYSYANRQVIAHLTKECFKEIFSGVEIETFWDLTHNSARWENHEINGGFKKFLVHRKGATRAFGPGREELPEDYREIGQPVIIGGTMGTYSFILRGTEKGMKLAFGSASHGAGRAMSRTKAKKIWRGQTLIEDLKRRGIYARTASYPGFAEEAPGAYKDVSQVIEAVDRAELAKKVVRMRPLGVIKG